MTGESGVLFSLFYFRSPFTPALYSYKKPFKFILVLIVHPLPGITFDWSGVETVHVS